MVKYWENENEKYIFFNNGIFSNFFKSEFFSNFSVDGELILFCCVEQYLMSSKAKLFNDDETYEAIMASKIPKEHKELGRQVKNFDDKIWAEKARSIAYVGIYDKFYQQDKLFSLLMSTNDKKFVEASPYDLRWGVGLHPYDYRIVSPNRWRGKNWLGQVLNKVKTDLASGKNESFGDINWNSIAMS